MSRKMNSTLDKAAPDPQQIITELQRKLDESRAELAARNSDYTERIAHQAAANEVLKVMSASPGDPQPVFDLIVERARDLCGGYGATVYQFDGTLIHWRAATGVSDDPSARQAVIAMYPMKPTRDWPAGRVIIDRQIIHIRDLETEPGLTPAMRGLTAKSVVNVPLMRSGLPIGAIALGSRELGGFTDTQVELLQTFADQAVIAIENARLFNETKEALERQTATADILKVIASSPSDVQPVFEAIAERSNRLLGGLSTAVFSLAEGIQHLMAFTHTSPAADAALQSMFPRPLSAALWSDATSNGETFQIADAEVELAAHPPHLELARLRGWQSVLLVPLLRGQEPIGLISVTRSERGQFADHHVQLLRTFADQAVIAIENVRLFNETQEALERQTATADILKVIASSPSNVQPVFDAILTRALHLCEAAFGFLTTYDGEGFEFAAGQGLPHALAEHFGTGMDQPRPGDAHWRLKEGEDLIHYLDQKDDDAYRMGNPLRRAAVDLGGVRSALVVALRHGGSLRGAITIYRQEVRPFSPSQIDLLRHFADQAVIAIENTRLFNETQEALERQTATAAELYPQEITRALLNLISNGFYAANKRKVESGDDSFEAVLSASTRDLGTTIEIRIRDNGTGIPPEVKEKMFNPFFTTKPTGEGTGLGLSMTHDIIVKQHGGRIDVETEPGAFTEFIITLPRVNGSPSGSKSE
jgi:GAF domain-containing protein